MIGLTLTQKKFLHELWDNIKKDRSNTKEQLIPQLNNSEKEIKDLAKNIIRSICNKTGYSLKFEEREKEKQITLPKDEESKLGDENDAKQETLDEITGCLGLVNAKEKTINIQLYEKSYRYVSFMATIVHGGIHVLNFFKAIGSKEAEEETKTFLENIPQDSQMKESLEMNKNDPEKYPFLVYEWRNKIRKFLNEDLLEAKNSQVTGERSDELIKTAKEYMGLTNSKKIKDGVNIKDQLELISQEITTTLEHFETYLEDIDQNIFDIYASEISQKEDEDIYRFAELLSMDVVTYREDNDYFGLCIEFGPKIVEIFLTEQFGFFEKIPKLWEPARELKFFQFLHRTLENQWEVIEESKLGLSQGDQNIFKNKKLRFESLILEKLNALETKKV